MAATHGSFQKLDLCVLCTLLTVVGGLRLGAFNAHVFGLKKAEKQDVMGVLAKIAVRYDILLLQEIKDISGEAIQKLLQKIKKDHGITMSINISDRLGRTSSKEQYAFLYRKDRGISVVSSLHFDDGDEATEDDLFQREPYIVRFKASKCRVTDFTLVALHTMPTQTVKELQALSQVVQHVRRTWRTDNIMVLGDLNADCKYVAKKYWQDIQIRHDSSFWWPIDNDVDTTVNSNTNCAYDRFIIGGKKLKEAVVTKSVRAFNFQTHYSLSSDQALAVSDHYPIELTLHDQARDQTSGSQPSLVSGSGTWMDALRHMWHNVLKTAFHRTSDSDL
ncbi:hypothetical protein ACOMHN_060670 [Nucella lapillus]